MNRTILAIAGIGSASSLLPLDFGRSVLQRSM
jgi:hypothetical protein